MKNTVLITGCSSGIGLCAATYLRDQLGYRVIASCRKEADRICLEEKGFEVILLDLDSSESVQAACREVERLTGGKLYGLINNAGYGVYGLLESISRAQLEAQFAANFFGMHELTIGLLPLLKASEEARIIQIGSMSGFFAAARRGAYCASKYAMEAWSDTLRLELHNTSIQISILEPGPIHTNFTRNVCQAEQGYVVTNPKAVKFFALNVEAILPKLNHALQSRRAKARYRVTVISHVMWYLKKWLPTSLFDRCLREK